MSDNKPEHVESLEGGGHMCRSCGGAVGEDGYFLGGEVEHDPDTELGAMLEGTTDDEPQQGQQIRKLTDAAGFTGAVRNRRR